MAKIKIPREVRRTLQDALGVTDSEYGFQPDTREKVQQAEDWLNKNTEEE